MLWCYLYFHAYIQSSGGVGSSSWALGSECVTHPRACLFGLWRRHVKAPSLCVLFNLSEKVHPTIVWVRFASVNRKP